MGYRQKSIKNWAEDDRPREKMLSKGQQSLSDSELLAILLRSGDRQNSALDLAKQILASVDNNWNDLSRLSVKELCRFKGVGPVKAVTVITALEIGRRKATQELSVKPRIRSATDIFELMQPLLGDLNTEEFWVLYLNQKNLVLKKERISAGGITQTVVDPRLIFKHALLEGATGIVLVHNHPSSNLKPSHSDKSITSKIKTAARSLDIEVLDHVIITQKNYFSFAEEGLL
jgi:DNA repair protein RadC